MRIFKRFFIITMLIILPLAASEFSCQAGKTTTDKRIKKQKKRQKKKPGDCPRIDCYLPQTDCAKV